MTHRLPPGSVTAQINEINTELMRIPNALLPKIKQELMVPQDKDFSTMTPEEKVCFRIFRFGYSFTILFSTELLLSTEASIVPSPSLRVSLNNRLTLLGLLQHL